MTFKDFFSFGIPSFNFTKNLQSVFKRKHWAATNLTDILYKKDINLQVQRSYQNIKYCLKIALFFSTYYLFPTNLSAFLGTHTPGSQILDYETNTNVYRLVCFLKRFMHTKNQNTIFDQTGSFSKTVKSYLYIKRIHISENRDIVYLLRISLFSVKSSTC